MLRSVCLLLLSSSLLPIAATASGPPTILVFGDSISAAYGMRVEEGWVALLQSRLEEQGYGWRVVNASVSGETTAGGRARLERALKLHQPRVVILELGANDGLRGLPLERMRANLEAMISSIRAHEAEVVLVGMPLPTNYGPVYTRRFRAVFEDLADKHRLAFVPFLMSDAAARRTLLQEDGLHPNAKAQPLLLERIWSVLHKTITAADGAREEPRWKKSG